MKIFYSEYLSSLMPRSRLALGVSIAVVFLTACGFSNEDGQQSRDEQNHNSDASLVQPGEFFTITGKAFYAGISQEWTLKINDKGHAVSEISGSYNSVTGYDGETVWRIENGAGPFNIDFAEREAWIMALLALSGREGSALASEHTDDDASETYAVPDGILQFEKKTDTDYVATNSPNEEAIIFSEDVSSQLAPAGTVFSIQNIGSISEYQIVSAEITSSEDDEFASRPSRVTDGFKFVSGVEAEIEVRQTESGHMFFRPLVNGEDLGWFLFDSGAGFSGLSGKLAEAEGFQKLGAIKIGGIGGPGMNRDRYIGGTIQVGPLVIDTLEFMDVGDMRIAEEKIGEPVVGVLGWDLLTRAIVEIDLRDGRMFIRDPSVFRAPSEHRRQLYLHWSVPYVNARFEGDRNGAFMLDSGAGDSGVMFNYFTTNRLNLLDGRAGEESEVRGAGGVVSVILGTLDWLEVGGHRTFDIPTEFPTAEDYEGDLFTVGILGGIPFAPFRVTLDYGRGEVGFIPREDD